MITKITVDGIDFTDSIESRDFVLVYELDAKTRALSLGTTNEISFYRDGYKWFEQNFFNNFRTDFYKTAEVKITIDCCGKREYTFIVDAEGLTICPDNGTDGCSVRAVLRTNEDINRKYRELTQRIFWKKYGNKSPLGFYLSDNRYFAKLNYLATPSFFHYILYYLWIAATPLTGLLSAIADFFGPNNAINRAEDWLVGAGRFQIAFNIRKAIEYNTNNLGINFVSPVLQSQPYDKLFWLEARYDNGIDQRWKFDFAKVNSLWENNAPNKTIIDLLTDLSPVFNHDFRLIGNDLVFDTRENIIARLDTLFNLDQTVKDNGLQVCFKYQQLKAYAYGRFEYTDDSSETEGNKASTLYNDLVDWNVNPTNDFQRDELRNIVQFAPVRFQNDMLQDKYDIEEIWFNIERSRRNPNFGRPHENEVMLSNGYAYVPKLIVLDNQNKPKRFFRKFWKTFINGNIPMYEYNTDMFFDENKPNNLYTRFHYTENPRTRIGDVIEVDTIEVPLSCELVDKIEQSSMNLKIDTKFGPGLFDKVEINFTAGIIKIEGLKI